MTDENSDVASNPPRTAPKHGQRSRDTKKKMSVEPTSPPSQDERTRESNSVTPECFGVSYSSKTRT